MAVFFVLSAVARLFKKDHLLASRLLFITRATILTERGAPQGSSEVNPAGVSPHASCHAAGSHTLMLVQCMYFKRCLDVLFDFPSFNGMLVNLQGISLKDLLVMVICLTCTLGKYYRQDYY